MKRLLFLFIAVLISGWASAHPEMQKANDLYGQQKFEEAITVYESLISNDLHSHEIYFNLANAYYRTSQNTLAILNYERALLLKPNDEATTENLSIAQLQVTDKFEKIPELFISAWFRSAFRFLTPSTWAVWSMVFFAFCILMLGTYFLSKNASVRKLSFYTSIIALGLTLVSILFAGKHNSYVNGHKNAIVKTAALTVTSAPNQSGSELFVVHEGTKVRVNKKMNEWLEIKLQDGRVGWVKTTDVIRI